MKELGFVDRYLTAWILGAMLLGVIIGFASPASADRIDSWSSGGVNWPIAIGLIVMMFPPLARVNYDRVFQIVSGAVYLHVGQEDRFEVYQSMVDEVTVLLKLTDPKCGPKCLCLPNQADGRTLSTSSVEKGTETSHFNRLLGVSMFINWLVGPFLMFFLGLIFLPDKPSYIRGLIMVGLARCIAMVIIWNDLANGSPEYAAILVCLNSMFQILFYSPYAYLFISVFLPGFNLTGSGSEDVVVSFGLVAKSVAIYLGIPFGLGLGSWLYFNRALQGDGWKQWYKTTFVPYTAPLTLIALLFTIIVMFILKGRMILTIPVAVIRVSLPLCAYFGLMFVGVYYCSYRLGFTLEETITLSFTSASNNFELAIAVSIAVFGLDSPEAFVGVIGPLVEVPVMLAFVHLVKVLHRRWPTVSVGTGEAGQELADIELATCRFNNDCGAVAVPSPMHSKSVMFLCTGNSCRSHMAQAWTWYYHSHLNAYSAGTSPIPGQPGPINPLAAEVLMEFGLDVSLHRSKHMDDLQHVSFDLVVTVCDDAATECPSFKSSASQSVPRIVHHSFDDPPRLVGAEAKQTQREKALQLVEYRRVCEEIRTFVRDDLLKYLP